MADAQTDYAGTREVAAQLDFDRVALQAWLQAHVPAFEGPLSVLQFKGGQSNPTYLLQTPQRRFVMRSKPAPAALLLPSAHAIEREFRVLAALAGTDVPVPGVIALCADEAVIGRAFYVMAHVEGRVLWDQALPGLSAPERQAIYRETNRVISTLHRVDPAAVGLGDFGKPGNYFARQIDRWSRQFRAAGTEPIAAMEHLMQWLPRHIPPGDESAIVHGDFRLDNVIFAADAPRALAVLDWELSTVGHPLADFAYHCLAWHIAPGRFRGIAGLDHAALGIPSESDYVRDYCAATGRIHADVSRHWDFYLAFNLFRLAAILQGIMKRAVDGTAASASALEEGGRARAMAETGWRIAQRAGY